jgi:Zn finger protein HypA/HybF involved in hydrogenase expression
MGMMITAVCSCGYHSLAFLGGGMDNFDRECPVPFHCRNCRSVVNANLLAAEPTCPKCGTSSIVPYTDASLLVEPGPGEVAYCNVFSEKLDRVSLRNGTYLCPSCGKATLRFTNPGCYD